MFDLVFYYSDVDLQDKINKIPPLPEMIPLIRLINPDFPFFLHNSPNLMLSLLEVCQIVCSGHVLTLTSIYFRTLGIHQRILLSCGKTTALWTVLRR
jgi:hypothetical protein